MARLLVLLVVCASFVFPTGGYAAISVSGAFIRDRAYRELSTQEEIPGVIVKDTSTSQFWKASGNIPTVSKGMVAWSDGRGGNLAVMGYDLTDPANLPPASRGEFVISAFDVWQENNPWVGYDAVGGKRVVVYDTHRTISPAEPGNIEARVAQSPAPAPLPPVPAAQVNATGRQLNPVLTNPWPGQNALAWAHTVGPSQDYNDYLDIDIYVYKTDTTVPLSLTVTGVSVTSERAPRAHLAGDSNRLVWQELYYNETNSKTYWRIGNHEMQPGLPGVTALLPDFAPGKSQTQPDVSKNLMVYAQQDVSPGAIDGAGTNIWLVDLSATTRTAVALTNFGTSGGAMNPAISKTFWADGVERAFVVYQGHTTNTTSFFDSGVGEYDYDWDIYAQELVRNNQNQWVADGAAFRIREGEAINGVIAGRQTCPDIDGFDVVWQSQDRPLGSTPGYYTKDVYVWGAVMIPEPCTLGLLLAGAGLAALRRRRK